MADREISDIARSRLRPTRSELPSATAAEALAADSPATLACSRDYVLPDGRVLLLRIFRAAGVLQGWIEDGGSRQRFDFQLRHPQDHDTLTELPGRRLFGEQLASAISRAQQHPAILVYIDLDGFRAVNNRIGHGAGDVVLREFADLLRAQLQTGEIAARLGGDEFAMLLTGGVDTLARTRRIRLRQILDGISLRLRGVDWAVKASAGCVALHPAMTCDEALAVADRRCAASKARGVYHRRLRPI